VLLRSLTNYFNHRIAYDDVAQTNHTIASICNRLRCEKACPLLGVLNPISEYSHLLHWNINS